MKIILIVFVYVILSSEWSLKKTIFDQKGGQNSKKSKKVPLDILEIHVVSKFDPILMKIVACSSLEHKQQQQTTMDISVPQFTNILT